jgi:hypothetical protein
MKQAIGLAVLSLAGVQAGRWAPAARRQEAHPTMATIALLDLEGSSPRPTEAPVWPFELNKRGAKDNTCAYVNGDTASALGCPTTAGCVYNSLYSVMGCCPDTSSKCPIPTTCYDYTQSASYTTTNENDLYWYGSVTQRPLTEGPS